MPSLAANFLNVRTEDGFTPAVGDDFTDRLGEMIRATSVTVLDRMTMTMMTRPLPPERTLWFPPGEYRVRADFAFPPVVTLSFAPGAVIVPVRTTVSGVRREVVTIAGPVEASLNRIFANEVGAPAGVPVGRVTFVGEGTTRVYPEWWGAARTPGSPNAAEDTAAIRSAIRAASIDREALTSTDPRPPVAITFSGSYEVNDTIEVRPTTESGFFRTLVLEGMPGQGGAMISISSERLPDGSFTELASIFALERVLQVVVRNLTLRALGRARECLIILPYLIRNPFAHTVILERCTFDGADEHQVWVLETSSARPALGSLSIRVRTCNFTLSSADAPFDVNHRSTANGLYVQGAWGADLAVEGCTFDGHLFRGVLTLGGVRSKVTGCTFRFRSSSSEMLPNGAAIVLERLGIAEAGLPTLEAICCDAATPSFLWVEAPQIAHEQELAVEFAAGVRVVLTAITHRVDRTRPLGLYWPPAVVWRGGPSPFRDQPDPPGNNSQLTLIGCLFEVPTVTSPKTAGQIVPNKEDKTRLDVLPRVPRVFVNATVRRVLNVGTFSEDFPPHAIGAFRTMPMTEVRSLGPGRSVPGPAIAQQVFSRGLTSRLRQLFAWADW